MTPNAGQTASVSRVITAGDIAAFTKLSGDDNPVHTKMGVAHGLLTASLVSRLIGTVLPGPGAVWTKADLVFEYPVYAGDTLTATGVIERVYPPLGFLTMSVLVVNQDKRTVLSADCTVRP